ncbi:hypothetical protein [Roseomonas mucosa]|uniref:hypothetical protein n=1 Tax=Roseomonas mucosa TaxID=207340 RepID=UPI0022457EE4|nr:hypothetical protein [Roseomonas mucosa]UZO91724.1 putative membrane associated protein [Roseomonas mucosa]
MRRLAIVAGLGVALATPAFAQTTQQTTTAAGATAIAIGGGSSGDGRVTYGGDYTVRNVPSPSSYLALPPCGSGASIGVGWAGAGFSASAGGEAEGCARRATAAALNAMGMREEAVALLQQDPNVAKAFNTAAEQRRARGAAVPAAPAAPQPAMVRFATSPQQGRGLDWCRRAAPTTEAGREYVRQVCGG